MTITRKGAIAAAAAIMAVSSIPVLASTAQADPSCTVGTSGSPGSQTFTLNVTSNPCGRKVRAYVTCTNENGASTGTEYGPAITGTGKSKADCGSFRYVNKWGHEVNVPGQGWTRYPGS
ncbi:hypothetical protein ACFS5L_26085 [Streptomyces phyllanthi]|uniref:Secreted protein n=1 Tax=Streptomyces phyllanthi TaxID=1803180 RepID=A0A5N8W515_9ACTN|nr:hypothetical protein [Streptomyces phyllanthi]